MMESFKMSMKDVEFVQEIQINSGASHDETFNELHTKSFKTEKCRNILDFITLKWIFLKKHTSKEGCLEGGLKIWHALH